MASWTFKYDTPKWQTGNEKPVANRVKTKWRKSWLMEGGTDYFWRKAMVVMSFSNESMRVKTVSSKYPHIVEILTAVSTIHDTPRKHNQKPLKIFEMSMNSLKYEIIQRIKK